MVYPRFRSGLQGLWAEAVRNEAGVSDARRYASWGVDYRRGLISLIGHPEASAELGVVVAPWRVGWPREDQRAGAGQPFVTGIGAMIAVDGGFPKIVSIMPGGPAARDRRLRSGDRIEAIAQGQGEFEDSRGLALERVLLKTRGPKGSIVRLRIRRGAAPGGESLVVTLERNDILLTDPDACPAPREDRPRPPARRRSAGAAGAAAFICVLLAAGAGLRATKPRAPLALPAA